MYLDWHHASIRIGSTGYMLRKYFTVKSSQESVDEAWDILNRTLRTIEKIWLPKNATKQFMFGDKPSIADLSLAGEVSQLEAINYPLKQKFPSIHTWLYENMMGIEGYKTAHVKGVPLFA